MASKVAEYETGYEDERFEQIASQSFHCIICTNVIKDAVMCPQNEHVFCRACITRHPMYSQTCPTCMQPLTADTLTQTSRGIRNLLAELKIRCDFFNRGCGKFVELGDLDRHAADCGFAPAVCSNEGCQLEVNKQDLLHHESAVCELRRVQCHSCHVIRRELDGVTLNLATVNERLLRIEKNFVAEFEQVQQTNRQLQADNVEIKKSLSEITQQLERMAQQRLCETQANEIKNENNKDDRKSVVNDGHVSPNFLQIIEVSESPTSSDEGRDSGMSSRRGGAPGKTPRVAWGGRLRGDRGGMRSSGDRDGMRSNRDRDGMRSSGDRDGMRSNRDRDGMRSSGDRDGMRSNRDRDGMRSSRDRDGMRSNCDRDDRRSRGDQDGIRSRRGSGNVRL